MTVDSFFEVNLCYIIYLKLKLTFSQKNRVADQLMSRDEDQETEDLEFDPVLQPDQDSLDICVAYLNVETLYTKEDLDEDEVIDAIRVRRITYLL